ncbi:hypothetical protein [Rhodopila sp.]|uniref:hypothetical protein n=1 Tax=Rhodopila sp. TaxID=2480087 RepID=UPI003D151752
MRRRDGLPFWINEPKQHTKALRRVDLESSTAPGVYDEAWLQGLLHRHPEVLPIEQIEPGFGDLIPLCRELPLSFGGGRSGALDNLFVTRDGGLVFIEAKLWRNPEARRAVVAQAMEYAAAVFGMNYSELQRAVIKARCVDKATETSLFGIVNAHAGELDEAEFIDAISRNLRRGRAIIAVVGDGIREDILPLVNLLQSHAGHRFTFALVELAIYETPEQGVRLVVPSILAQTALIERGVIRIEGDGLHGVRVEVAAPPDSSSVVIGQRMTIGEDEFFEKLGQTDLRLPELLKAFLAKAEALNVYTEFQSALSLKHASPEGKPLNMGTIRKDGFVDTSPVTWWGRTKFGAIYNNALAAQIGGKVNSAKQGQESAVRTAAAKTPKLSDFLPQHEQAWLDAIEQYIRSTLNEAPDESQVRNIADEQVRSSLPEEC